MRSTSESSLRDDYPSSDRENKSNPGSSVSPGRFYVTGGNGEVQRADGTQGLVSNTIGRGLANPRGAAPVNIPLGPQLRAVDLPLVTDLVGELLGMCDSRARFREVDGAQVIHAENCFVRYKCALWIR